MVQSARLYTQCISSKQDCVHKMQTMNLIMAEASKALSTVITPIIAYEESSLSAADCENTIEKDRQPAYYFPDDCDDEDAKSLNSTRASSIASHRSIRGCTGIQLTFLPDASGCIPWVQHKLLGASGDGDQSVADSMITAETTLATSSQSNVDSRCKNMNEEASLVNNPQCPSTRSLRRSSSVGSGMRRHPIRVSFVPIDLDTPLQEQHGGAFDVILHKMTEDILCISKMLRSQQQHHVESVGCKGDRVAEAVELLDSFGDANHDAMGNENADASHALTRHQERAARRIQRLRAYKENSHPSCVLVDSPINILAVMSRADMAQVLLSCLEGVKTRGGISVNTPQFRVVEEGEESMPSILAKDMDAAGFRYPLIAKPLTAAGTKSSHHMGIVLSRDGLMRLKTPILLQEFCNHGATLFKTYVLGESVWVFARESLPNLPPGENELPTKEDIRYENRPSKSYVEFERHAGSKSYVEFNSQRPYPTLSDFGICDSNTVQEPDCKKARLCTTDLNAIETNKHEESDLKKTNDLASYVTKEEIEPVTNILRAAFGLDLFGFDVLVKHDQSDNLNVSEILVVDVNYFPGYKEVPNFPTLLAQYLTQKAVETRMAVPTKEG